MRVFDLSFRHKIPLWGATLIVVTALAVSATLMVRAYEDLKQALVISSESLGRTLAKTLFPAMLHDDVWGAFEIVNAPLHRAAPENPVQAEAILVLSRAGEIYVSTEPFALPMLRKLSDLEGDYPRLSQAMGEMEGAGSRVIELPGSKHIYVATPVAEEGARLGTLVMIYSKTVFLPQFFGAASRGALAGALVLAVLLPINWYWGQRMAVPLVLLAGHMSEIRRRVPEALEPSLYAYQDELGRLFEAYNVMVKALEDKAVLEQEVLHSERLAAIGRLAAGIAHEINNPLAGMLTAIDTLRQRGDLDGRTGKTLSLVERGLLQVRDTVGVLLIQAKAQSRPLTTQDLEDVRVLMLPQAQKKLVRLEWKVDLPDGISVPAGFVRQILINLLLNAIQAATEGGRVGSSVAVAEGELSIVVENDGRMLTAAEREHLFEPFTTTKSSGHGLGLWVTYQIVSQLGGRITAQCDGNTVCFTVRLPLEEHS